METSFFDALETRSADEREAALMAALCRNIAHAKQHAPGFAEWLGDIDPNSITDRTDLSALPVLRKSDLAAWQAKWPPFGGLTTKPANSFRYLFQSPGPIYEPGDDSPDWWGMARALHAAGFRRGDIAHNSFSYHATPAGAMLDNGARALGAAVIPAGVGGTEAQARAAADLGATGYVGTPDFLKALLDKALDLDRDLSRLTKALVSGGALMPDLRTHYRESGLSCLQCYGTADLGLIAYESPAMEGLIVDERMLVEILRPGTNMPVDSGEVGEVVVTTLNRDYPLIRFGTGDLSRDLAGESPCGRTNARLAGWMGRADQTTKVKGMFVRPEQIAQVVERHPGIGKARLVVSREGAQDVMVLRVEVPLSVDVDQLLETLLSVVKLRGKIETVPVGSLPDDGKVIDDTRELG